ncbi:MAG: NADH:flavin oxidoreductase [Anaerolineae bacterium]|nr:NADH:flavin oxidoreductase [Anaerolineae bacterium]
MPHERFRFKSLEELLAKAEELGVELPVQRDLSPLARQVSIGGKLTPNALGIHPMEGCDGTTEGKPGELTVRRYLRFARGGAGLLWFEATAIVPEGRANPHQLLLVPENAAEFAALREQALNAGREVNGPDYEPFTVLQITHSGRYSRPVDKPAPIIAHHDGILDKVQGLPEDYPLISDEELDRLQDRYLEAARLVYQCGFDGVDIKSCHRYLISELLAAHTRPGRYGGSFENRTRLLREVVARIREELPELRITIRLNVYDGHPYPWGWGVSKEDPRVPDLREPLKLIGILQKLGVSLINVTAGNPYYTPHINRPFDQNVIGGYIPDEHPLEGVARMIWLARQVKEAYPDLVVVGSGYSWLRHYFPQVAAAVIQRGWADIVALGRGAFAYPDFARDILQKGKLDPRRTCITCSRCTQIMRDHGPTGCVVFDKEVYGPIYREGRRRHRA